MGLSVLGLLSAPLFVALLGLEIAWSQRRGLTYHSLRETVASLAVGATEQAISLLITVPLLGLYALALRASPWALPVDSPWTWALAAVTMDFLYYWYHRAGHEVRFVWAFHAVHHQARDFNFSVAVRNAAFGKVVQFAFTAPLALLGVPLVTLVVLKTVMNAYMFLQHTRTVGRLGRIEQVFVTPSIHRVHHAVNLRFVDHNYGGILSVWDRWFGTFQEEDEPCVFDRVPDHPGYDPVRANLIGWEALAADVGRARSVREALRVLFGRPRVDYAGAVAEAPRAGRDPLDHYAYLQLVGALGGLAAGPAAVAVVLAGLVVPTALLDRRRWAIPAEQVRLTLTGVAAIALAPAPVAAVVLAWAAGSALLLALSTAPRAAEAR